MAKCDVCGEQTSVVVPFMRKPAGQVLDDITNMDRHLPRSALSDEQNEAIPWGTHPDDDRFGQACVPCGNRMAFDERERGS